MKNFCKVFLSMALFVLLGLTAFACDGKYDGLSMSSYFYYSPSSVTALEDGTSRVSTSNGIYDVNPDGSYTMYISDTFSCSAVIGTTFDRAPGDFSYGVALQQSNEILEIARISQMDGNTVYTTIRAVRDRKSVV